jgi:hypothetical protein
MGISKFDFDKMKERVEGTHDAPPLESELHKQIIDWCSSFWPRLKYIHGRMDKKSTLDKGCPDFIVFMPDKMVLCLEAKKKGCKPSLAQRDFHKEMEMLCHRVFVVTTMEEVKQAYQDTICQRHDDEFFRNNNT